MHSQTHLKYKPYVPEICNLLFTERTWYCFALHAVRRIGRWCWFSRGTQPRLCARSQWWVGYMLNPNENYLNKGPGFLDPRWDGSHPGYPRLRPQSVIMLWLLCPAICSGKASPYMLVG